MTRFEDIFGKEIADEAKHEAEVWYGYNCSAEIVMAFALKKAIERIENLECRLSDVESNAK